MLSRGTPKKEGIERWDGEQAREARSGKPEIPPRFQKVKKSSQDQPFILTLCHLFFCLPAEGENTANGSFPNRGKERLHKKHRHRIWNIPLEPNRLVSASLILPSSMGSGSYSESPSRTSPSGGRECAPSSLSVPGLPRFPGAISQSNGGPDVVRHILHPYPGLTPLPHSRSSFLTFLPPWGARRRHLA